MSACEAPVAGGRRGKECAAKRSNDWRRGAAGSPDPNLEVFDFDGLDVLCETHDRIELDRAISLGFDLIGVNSRDLRTFSVHPEILMELAANMPKDVVMVAESGIRTAEDIARLRDAGYGAFLVGEALMRQPDPAAALALLLDREYSSEN